MSQSQDGLESLVPRIPDDNKNPFADDVRHPATPVVLEAIDTGRELRERPVSVLCPGCGNVLTRHRDGLPLRVARVEEHCETCATTLQRWAVVAIGTAYERAPSPAQLRDTVTDYWHSHLWAGITTGEDNPRTVEYSRLYSEQAETFEWDWTVSCPLCRTAVDDLDVERLDYHHWSRTPDQGVCLCRPCHNAIDGQQHDTDQDWQAQKLGLRDNHDLQLTRLAMREQAVVEHDSLRALVDTIHNRYNLVQSPAQVYALLRQTLADGKVLSHTHDEHLLDGVRG